MDNDRRDVRIKVCTLLVMNIHTRNRIRFGEIIEAIAEGHGDPQGLARATLGTEKAR